MIKTTEPTIIINATHFYRKTPRLSILVLGNFLGGRTEMLTFERS